MWTHSSWRRSCSRSPIERSDDASSRGEKGQGLAEYALILGLIALIAIGAVMFLGPSMNTMFSNLGTSI